MDYMTVSEIADKFAEKLEKEIKQLKEKRKLSIQKEQLLRKEEVLITIDQIGEFTVDARQLYEIIFKEQNKTYNW